jgi:hypothetical protein
MGAILNGLFAAVLLSSVELVWTQTVDDVIERSVTAMGGRPAFAKVKSRSTTGTITLVTPGGEVTGSIDVLNAVPNKSRSLIQIDLSALGAGPYVLDTRFDGTAGYVLDNLQGNREMADGQLSMMRNSSFPHSFLNYKELGATVQRSGTEKVGERDAYLLIVEPSSGSVVRQYLDTTTYLPVRTVVKVQVPQLGQEIEQTTDYSDYRDVDGVKLPFRLAASSSIQSYTITVTKVEHNVTVDETLFSKPQ